MSAREIRDTVPASREVLRHHGELHAAGCPTGGPVETMCDHGTTVLIGCTACGEAVYVVYAAGARCFHFREVENGLAPSGLWTEVGSA